MSRKVLRFYKLMEVPEGKSSDVGDFLNGILTVDMNNAEIIDYKITNFKDELVVSCLLEFKD